MLNASSEKYSQMKKLRKFLSSKRTLRIFKTFSFENSVNSVSFQIDLDLLL